MLHKNKYLLASVFLFAAFTDGALAETQHPNQVEEFVRKIDVQDLKHRAENFVKDLPVDQIHGEAVKIAKNIKVDEIKAKADKLAKMAASRATETQAEFDKWSQQATPTVEAAKRSIASVAEHAPKVIQRFEAEMGKSSSVADE